MLEITQDAHGAHARILNHQKSDKGQRCGHRQIAGGAGTVWHQSNQVAKEDKEKSGAKIGRETQSRVLTHVGFCNLVSDENYKSFHKIGQPPGHHADSFSQHDGHKQEQKGGQKHHNHMLGQTNIHVDAQHIKSKECLRQMHLVAEQRRRVLQVTHDHVADFFTGHRYGFRLHAPPPVSVLHPHSASCSASCLSYSGL